jgi:porin
MLAFLTPSAWAEDAAPAKDASGLFQQETLTGDWFGARKQLENIGVQLGADEIFDSLADPTGGQKQGAAFEGRFEGFLNIDLGKVLGLNGAIFHANAYQIHGRGLTADDVGNLLTVGNIGADPGTRLFSIWIQQSLFDDTVSVRAGQIAADDEFFVSQYASLFINSTFGWPSILGINLPSGGPAYPLATPGVRIKVALSPSWTIMTAVFNGDPAPPGPGDPQQRDANGANFRLNGGAFGIGELAYNTNVAIDGDDLPGTYKVGAWYHDGLFADQSRDAAGLSLADPASSGIAGLHRGDFGGYVIVDQLLWRKNGSSDQGLGLFFRAGSSPADRNLIEFHMDGGLTYIGLLPGRDNDTVGIGMSYEDVSSARGDLSQALRSVTALNLPIADLESDLEISYQAQIAPWWILQPDAQLVIHPGGRISTPGAPSTFVPGNAVILGVRTDINL